MRNITAPSAAVVLVSFGTVLFSGCVAAMPNVTPSTISSQSAASPLFASPSSTGLSAQHPSDPSTWLVDAAGVGPLRIGDSIAEARAQLGVYQEATTDVCAVAFFTGSPGPDVWLVPEVDADVVKSIVLTGNTQPEVVRQGSPRTDQGVGVGSSVGALGAAYPDLQTSKPESDDSPGETYFVATSRGYLNFAVVDDLVQSIVVSDEPEIPYEFCG